MRKFSKHTPEQIVVKLEKAEALLAPAQSPQAPHCAAPTAPGRG